MMEGKYNDLLDTKFRVKQQNIVPAAAKINLLAQYNATNNSIEYRNAANTVIFSINLTTGLTTASKLAITGVIGFNGTTPIAKPTVTGSRGANVALASLLTALANLGLITDSSS